MRIREIQWDTEDGGEIVSPRDLGLPLEVDAEPEDVGLRGFAERGEILDRVSDFLSDKFGYCVKSFTVE